MKLLRIGFTLFFFSVSTLAVDTDAPSPEPEANRDAPNILYVVPWNETPTQKAKDPKLVIHDLVGDLYEPQLPSDW